MKRSDCAQEPIPDESMSQFHTGNTGKPRLLDRVRNVIRCKHYSIRTEQSYVEWIKRYIYFHDRKHPKDLDENHLSVFLTYLAVERKVASSTQNQALCALIFLYKEVIKKDIGQMDNLIRAKRLSKLPVVFSREEVRKVLLLLDGPHSIMGHLLYGAGLRLMECIRLRVKDVDFDYKQIVVRDGNMYSPPAVALSIHAPTSKDGIIYLNQSYTAPLKKRYAQAALLKPAAATLCDTASPPICWNRAMISVPSRNYWGIRMSPLR